MTRHRLAQLLHRFPENSAHTLHSQTVLKLKQMLDLLAALIHREDKKSFRLEHLVILAVITHDLRQEVCASSCP